MKGNSANYIAFDLGSHKISAVAAHISKQGEGRILAQVLKSSEGFNRGFISNMQQAQNSLVGAIYTIEQNCARSITDVALSLSGPALKSFYVDQSIKLNPNQAITKNEVKKLLHRAKSNFKVNNYEIIHYIPVEFVVNGKAVEDPVGLHSSELSCNLHLIAVDSEIIVNLTKCFAKCQVEVSEVVSGIYASSSASLTKDELKVGSMLIDIGADSTSYGIFLDNKLVYINHVASGGADMTMDIARKFAISIKDAERIKILYGNAHPSLLIQNSVIKVEGSDKIIMTSDLAHIIYERAKEIFAQIKTQCEKMAIDRLSVNQVVLTGGSSILAGLGHLASEILAKQVRVARPEPVVGFSESANPYAETTILGMVKHQILLSKNRAIKYDPRETESWLKRAFLWIKENI